MTMLVPCLNRQCRTAHPFDTAMVPGVWLIVCCCRQVTYVEAAGCTWRVWKRG